MCIFTDVKHSRFKFTHPEANFRINLHFGLNQLVNLGPVFPPPPKEFGYTSASILHFPQLVAGVGSLVLDAKCVAKKPKQWASMQVRKTAKS